MKQKGKRVLAVALSALLSLSTLPSVAFASNTPSAWAQNQVNEAISYGLVPDSIRGDYQSPITRIEFAELIVELALDYYARPDLYTAMGVEPREENMGQYMFQDVAQEDHYVARLAYGLRFMDGIGDHLFGPDQLLTREQAATIMVSSSSGFPRAAKPWPKSRWAKPSPIQVPLLPIAAVFPPGPKMAWGKSSPSVS